MKFEELLTTYWSQLTLILIAFGYFIKRIFDNRSKKIEINHSLYQQFRLKSVNEFFTNYAKAELMWNHIEIYEILSKKLDVKKIDAIVFPTLNELKRTLFELKIYFNSKDHKYFEEIVNGIMSINNMLSTLYFNDGKELALYQQAIEFQIFKTNALKRNRKIINELSLIIKDTYKT